MATWLWGRTDRQTRMERTVADQAAEVLRLRGAVAHWEDRAKAAEARLREAETHARVLVDVVDRLTRSPSAAPLPASPEAQPLPDVVERAIASRAGRGNVNRVSQLRASARLLLKETQGDAGDVADTILSGSGDLDL